MNFFVAERYASMYSAFVVLLQNDYIFLSQSKKKQKNNFFPNFIL